MPTPTGRGRLTAALAAAALLHLGVLLGIGLVIETNGVGNGGFIQDAIGVTIVDSRVLATRDDDATRQAEANAISSIAATDGSVNPANIEPANIETVPITSAVQPAAPVEQPEQLVAKASDRAEVSPKSAPITATESRDTDPQPDAQPAPAPPRAASVPASPSGAAQAHIIDPANTAPQSGSAAASPGAMSAYARALASTLAKAPPPATRGLPGHLLIRLVVAEDGSVDAATIAKSSGSIRLDRLAVEAVERVRLPAPPSGMTQQQRTYELPYTFR